MSTYFIGAVERGQAALSLRSLAEIATALGVTLRALFEECDERDRETLRRTLDSRLRRATEDELRVLVELSALLQRRRR